MKNKVKRRECIKILGAGTAEAAVMGRALTIEDKSGATAAPKPVRRRHKKNGISLPVKNRRVETAGAHLQNSVRLMMRLL